MRLRKARVMKERSQSGTDSVCQRRFDEALRLRDQGRLVEAEEAFLQLMGQYPENLGIVVVRAGILFDLERFHDAHTLFKAILDSRPDHELASRGLFHSLWKLGKHDEAFSEMKRFLSIADSDAYAELLSDLKADLRDS